MRLRLEYLRVLRRTTRRFCPAFPRAALLSRSLRRLPGQSSQGGGHAQRAQREDGRACDSGDAAARARPEHGTKSSAAGRQHFHSEAGSAAAERGAGRGAATAGSALEDGACTGGPNAACRRQRACGALTLTRGEAARARAHRDGGSRDGGYKDGGRAYRRHRRILSCLLVFRRPNEP